MRGIEDCSILRLPPCHCVLNLIEMQWKKLKYHPRHLNVYIGQPSEIVD